jgi:hypothetical protein
LCYRQFANSACLSARRSSTAISTSMAVVSSPDVAVNASVSTDMRTVSTSGSLSSRHCALLILRSMLALCDLSLLRSVRANFTFAPIGRCRSGSVSVCNLPPLPLLCFAQKRKGGELFCPESACFWVVLSLSPVDGRGCALALVDARERPHPTGCGRSLTLPLTCASVPPRFDAQRFVFHFSFAEVVP